METLTTHTGVGHTGHAAPTFPTTLPWNRVLGLHRVNWWVWFQFYGLVLGSRRHPCAHVRSPESDLECEPREPQRPRADSVVGRRSVPRGRARSTAHFLPRNKLRLYSRVRTPPEKRACPGLVSHWADGRESNCSGVPQLRALTRRRATVCLTPSSMLGCTPARSGTAAVPLWAPRTCQTELWLLRAEVGTDWTSHCTHRTSGVS